MSPRRATPSRRKRSDRRWSEQDILVELPPTAFNFTTPAFGRLDDDDVLARIPSRVLDNWYLVRKTPNISNKADCHIFPNRRCAFPNQSAILDGYILRGTLHPMHVGQEPLRVELDQLQFYTLCSVPEYRGFWVKTGSAKYWLREPCSKRLRISTLKVSVQAKSKNSAVESVLDDGVELPSQKDLFAFHRAQLGLYSNLVDILQPAFCKDDGYVKFFSSMRPQDVFNKLLPSAEVQEHFEKWKQNNDAASLASIHEQPFDLKLLSKCDSAMFIKQHLQYLHKAMKGSVFLRELEDGLQKPESLYLCPSHEQVEFEMSSENSEKRSNQYSWGKSKDSLKSPNLLLPLEMAMELKVFNRRDESRSGPDLHPPACPDMEKQDTNRSDPTKDEQAFVEQVKALAMKIGSDNIASTKTYSGKIPSLTP